MGPLRIIYTMVRIGSGLVLYGSCEVEIASRSEKEEMEEREREERVMEERVKEEREVEEREMEPEIIDGHPLSSRTRGRMLLPYRYVGGTHPPTHAV